MREQLKKHVKWSEGWRNFPYEDSVGVLTIGVGRNLDHRGLTDDEVGYLLENDITLAIDDANRFRWFSQLDEVRKIVIADMIFNLGLTRFRGFIRMIQAMEVFDYQRAATEMQDSKWFRQTKRRAEKLVEMMRTGRL